MKITEDDFQNVISPLLVDLLRDPGFLQTDQDANAAVEKIKEVGLFNLYRANRSCFILVLEPAGLTFSMSFLLQRNRK